jgi:hypothetical protein
LAEFHILSFSCHARAKNEVCQNNKILVHYHSWCNELSESAKIVEKFASSAEIQFFEVAEHYWPKFGQNLRTLPQKIKLLAALLFLLWGSKETPK